MNKYSNFSKNVNPATTKVTATVPYKTPAVDKSDEPPVAAPDATDATEAPKK